MDFSPSEYAFHQNFMQKKKVTLTVKELIKTGLMYHI